MTIRDLKERLCDGCEYRGYEEVPCKSLECEKNVDWNYIFNICDFHNKKCEHCGNTTDFEIWEEFAYENSNDPTPEYGGALTPITFYKSKNIDCGEIFNE